MKKRRFLLKIVFFLLFNVILFGQQQVNSQNNLIEINYFGIQATNLESNMAKMISDLYYTQLCELQKYIIIYKRNEPTFTTLPNAQDFQNNSFLFFVEINKTKDSEIWKASFILLNSYTEKIIEKKYESFYKILMEQKATLQETLL